GSSASCSRRSRAPPSTPAPPASGGSAAERGRPGAGPGRPSALRQESRTPPMPTILKAPVERSAAASDGTAAQAAARIIDDVRSRGDAAVRDHSRRFDGWAPESFRLSEGQVKAIAAGVPAQVIADITEVQENVRRFAGLQRASLRELEEEVRPGVFLGQRHIPVRAVGAYIPGGRYPLTASAHMTIVTAKAAGVPRVVACTPP